MAKRAKNARRKRHRILAWVAACGMATVVIVVIVAIVLMLRTPKTPPSAVPPGGLPPSATATPHPHKPRPAYQDASCPDVQLINIPGTWESSLQDPPLAPIQFPNALLHNVIGTLTQQFGPARVQAFTTPYTAQFHNPLSADNQMSYNESRAQGTQATLRAMTDMNTKCPLTSYVIIGFSQGAVIAGDIASDIGNGRGPVDDDLVLGVTLIADGRRQVDVGKQIGPNPPGEGAEITLHEIPILSGLGLTMTGARPDGFGSLNDKTNEICAPGDLICAAPAEAFSITNLPNTLNTLAGNGAQPIHAMYATTQFWNMDGAPATDWTLNWAHGLIENAPHPKHG
ncbi:cutinase [Mycobacterium sp. 852002-51163_SCH5372311]|uniref:carboxylesterase Culp6 n=1 Tax=Mycobacterium sp. 852002-51163_SCH5372311 TaxID=1834097 RepID=UPI0007FD5295|nr:cutinase family protein [Mycobacterium sp. 852002-51163_SCH5372311]OBF88475.1 cutinase [Mycobacterium sp. 852002-51163_SCH5372311]